MTILWRSYDTGGRDNVISIPRLVEDNAESLRARYLELIYDLGESRVNGKRIVDHLEIRPGFSYWWMTLLAEKCNFAKSSQITDAIKLMAFDDWAKTQSFHKLTFSSANHELAKCLQAWCEKRKIPFRFTHKPIPKISRPVSRATYLCLPSVLQALIWLIRHVVSRLALCGVGVSEWKKSSAQITFISYLFNLVPSAVKDGHYESGYWTELPDKLNKTSCKTNWMHIYIPGALLPNATEAKRVLEIFNKSSEGKQIHVTLDSFLSGGVVFHALRDWFRLAVLGFRLKKGISLAINPSLDFAPLLMKDWNCSLIGKTAMSNALCLNLFEEALKALPKQSAGLYLQENQDWEFAFIHAWRTEGHGRLIGAPHSTVRFWDLRYFFDSRSYQRTGHNDLPMPDQVALNGAAMLREYHKGGYPSSQLVEVEALRYLYLEPNGVGLLLRRKRTNGPLRVLVLGDYLPSNTHQMMLLLEKAFKSLPANSVFTVKPHPNCPIRPEDYPSLKMRVTTEPISTLLADCDVAYTSAATSAAVDAYCGGIPVVSARTPKTLNLSPLRDCEGTHFASTPEELARALIIAEAAAHSPDRMREFLIIDNKLTRWRKLLFQA